MEKLCGKGGVLEQLYTLKPDCISCTYGACGINGIHLYALNKYDEVAYIAKEAGLLNLI